MKLLRIVSEEGQTTARIDAVFNDNLIIAPHSKIALINAMVNMADAYLKVDDTNDSLAFKTKATSANRSVTLPAGNYTPARLATSLAIEMNKALTYETDPSVSADLGFQWATGYSADNKLKIEFRRSDLKVLNMANITKMTKAGASPDFTYTKTGVDDWDSYAVTNSVFTRGAGYYEAKPYVGTAVSGKMLFLMGLTTDPTPLGASYKYAIGDLFDVGTYQIIVNGGLVTTTSVVVSDGDSVKIALANDTLSFKVNDVDVYTMAFDDYSSSYKCGFTIKNVGSYISSPQAYIDPYIVADGVELLTANASKVTVTFNKNTKHLLGFHNDNNNKNSVSGEFVAEEAIQTGGESPSMICEIGLPLDAFDSKLHKRRNIVAVMPNLDKINNNLIYIAPYPLFISLHNASTLLLNNLQVRLLDQSDEEEVALDVAGCALTFAICG